MRENGFLGLALVFATLLLATHAPAPNEFLERARAAEQIHHRLFTERTLALVSTDHTIDHALREALNTLEDPMTIRAHVNNRLHAHLQRLETRTTGPRAIVTPNETERTAWLDAHTIVLLEVLPGQKSATYFFVQGQNDDDRLQFAFETQTARIEYAFPHNYSRTQIAWTPT